MTNGPLLLPEQAMSLQVSRGLALYRHFRTVEPLNREWPEKSYQEIQDGLYRLRPPVEMGQLQEDYPEIFGGEK